MQDQFNEFYRRGYDAGFFDGTGATSYRHQNDNDLIKDDPDFIRGYEIGKEDGKEYSSK